MSGVVLIAEGEDFKIPKVHRVMESSPAAEAGLREGDVISTINNQPAARFTLEQVRRMFREEGREHRLTVERNAARLQVRLRLRRLI